jgi:5-methylcytosine-specific restriction endonuclease McrA
MVHNFLPPNLIETHRRELLQAQVLTDVTDTIANVLTAKTSLVTFDSLLFERFRHLSEARLWYEGLHHHWITANLKFALATQSSVMFRFIVVPYPYVLKNPYQRHVLRETIVELIHLHLWHGVIGGVIFLDPNIVSRRDAAEITFLSIPNAKIFFATPGYYEAEREGDKFIGGLCDLQMRRVHDWLVQRSLKPIWLFYEDAHYGRKRLTGWHWDQLRRFFVELNRHDFCPDCRASLDNTSVALDHIAPISKSDPTNQEFHQTIRNLRLLCRNCNGRKGNLLIIDPSFSRIYLPDRLNSEAVNRILKDRPPWLGKVRRPPRVGAALFQTAGLYP